MRRLICAFTFILCALGLFALLCVCGETAESCNHSFGEEIVEAAPSCTKSGKKIRKCTICGFEQSEEIPATGHSFEKVEVIAQPTCKEEGTERHSCACGAYEDKPIPKTGEHDYQYSESESQKATCTEDGKRVEICTVCGDRKEETLPASGMEHNFEWVTVKPATPFGEGVKQEICQNEGCGEIRETQTLPKTEAKNYFDFKVDVVRTTGAAYTVGRGAKLVVKDIAGNVVDSSLQLKGTFHVPEGEYHVAIENLPKGYSTEKEFYVADKDHTDITMEIAISPLPASEFTDKTKLGKGSILYDLELEVVEKNPADDYKTTFSELLKTYKCIYISLFFKTCQYCIQETDTILDVYNLQSPRAKHTEKRSRSS